MGWTGEWKGIGDTVNYEEKLLELLYYIQKLKKVYEEVTLSTGYDEYILDVVEAADGIRYEMQMEKDDE